MAITKRVQRELVEATPTAASSLSDTARPAAPRRRRRHATTDSEPLKLTKAQREGAAEKSKGKAWTADEHQRFLDALELFPAGPWKAIADYIGTKNSRQTMTHAQKCREKHERKTRALRKKKSAKKPKRLPTRRQLPRRCAASAASTQRIDHEDDSGALTDDSEDVECHRQYNIQDDEKDTGAMALDEATFFSGCDDVVGRSSVGSPPSMSLLSLSDLTLFSSDDLWHSPSLAEVALGADASTCIQDDDKDTTDLEDLHDFAAGLSQECW